MEEEVGEKERERGRIWIKERETRRGKGGGR